VQLQHPCDVFTEALPIATVLEQFENPVTIQIGHCRLQINQLLTQLNKKFRTTCPDIPVDWDKDLRLAINLLDLLNSTYTPLKEAADRATNNARAARKSAAAATVPSASAAATPVSAPKKKGLYFS
jgi:hypothetical protein